MWGRTIFGISECISWIWMPYHPKQWWDKLENTNKNMVCLQCRKTFALHWILNGFYTWVNFPRLQPGTFHGTHPEPASLVSWPCRFNWFWFGESVRMWWISCYKSRWIEDESTRRVVHKSHVCATQSLLFPWNFIYLHLLLNFIEFHPYILYPSCIRSFEIALEFLVSKPLEQRWVCLTCHQTFSHIHPTGKIFEGKQIYTHNTDVEIAFCLHNFKIHTYKKLRGCLQEGMSSVFWN